MKTEKKDLTLIKYLFLKILMKNFASVILFCSLLTLGGLVFWQVDHLRVSQNLEEKIEEENLSDALMQSAIQLRKWETREDSLRTDPRKKLQEIDKIVNQNFKNFDRKFTWEYLDGEGEYQDDLSRRTDTSQYDAFSSKVCISCLVTIDFVNEKGHSEVDKSFILNQTPGQMMDIRGLDAGEMEYLHLYTAAKAFSFKTYFIPTLFFLGLLALFQWLLFLNKKQHKLILQKNEFVNHLSHQFQTPLASIKLSANLLSHKQKENQDELIRVIQTESNRLENHIKTVLHWVKSDADRLHLSKCEIRLTQLIEDSLRQLKPIFITNKTKVIFIPPEDEIIINADLNHLQLIFFNIWENAIKHNDGPVEILISCKIKKDYIQVSSKDNGSGLQQGSETIKYSGLGLAYIEKLMSLHDGSMDLKSTGGKGLDVILNFPSHG
jgi:hypothetical protein